MCVSHMTVIIYTTHTLSIYDLLFFCGYRFNSSKKDNDFVYHETVPSLETLPSVKGNLRKMHYYAYEGASLMVLC